MTKTRTSFMIINIVYSKWHQFHYSWYFSMMPCSPNRPATY